MRNNIVRAPVKTALAEVQRYHSSLECLMEMGRGLLANPSLESTGADSYQVLVENVMEEAEQHTAVAEAVGEVTEPAAKVELIMNDVIVPHITKASEVESQLAEKLENEEEVEFTTQSEFTEALESLESDLGVLKAHATMLSSFRQVISLEGLDPDQVREPVMAVLGCFSEYAEGLGVSLESVGETQVLGHFSDAVERIESLVNTAADKAEEEVTKLKEQAGELGTDDDKIGDAIDEHRGENPSGGHLDEDVNISGVEGDHVDKDMNLETDETGDDGAHREEEEEQSSDNTDDNDESGEEETEEDGDLVDIESEETEEDSSDDSDEDEGSDGSDDDSEEEEDDEVSTESNVESVTLTIPEGEDGEVVRGYQRQLMSWLETHDHLSEAGKAAVAIMDSPDFVMDTGMVKPHVADVFSRYYDVWMSANVRDGAVNIDAMSALID